eukprot:scaffold15702_cov66-Phaeocystis_antarctica.AAC.6
MIRSARSQSSASERSRRRLVHPMLRARALRCRSNSTGGSGISQVWHATATRGSHLHSVVVLAEHGTDRAQGQEPTHLVAGLLELVRTRQVTSCDGVGLVGIGADEDTRARARTEAHVAQVDKPAELRVGAEGHVDHGSVRGHHLEGIDLVALGGRHHGVVAEVSSHIGIALRECSRRWTPRLHGSEVIVLPRSC